MAGRGRGRGGAGRGRGHNAFLPDDLKKTLEGAVVQPPQLYQNLPHKPVPLSLGVEYSSRIKSSVCSSSLSAPFRFFREDLASGWKFQLRYLFMEKMKKDIDRYTDKYAETPQVPQQNCDMDFNRIPRELKPCRKRKAKRKANLAKRRHTEDATQLLNTLENLEKQEGEEVEEDIDEEEANKKQEDGEDEEEEEEVYDSENDENDYNDNYFDNGENYGDDSDGSGGEAVY